MITIAIANQKGGVGKTTSAINIATAMAASGWRTLLIDLDPQGNASTGLGIENSAREYTSYDLLMGEATLSQAAQKSEIPSLDVVPATQDLSGAEVELVAVEDRTHRLRKALGARDSGSTSYDVVFIDCPPSLSLLTVMSLVSANELLIPLQTEFFALEGITQLVKTIDRIKVNLNPELSIRGVLLTMFDKRNKLSSEVDTEARKHFKDKVYKTVVPRNVRLSEAPSHGMPCLIYDKNCSGSKSYVSLAEEFINQRNQSMGSAA